MAFDPSIDVAEADPYIAGWSNEKLQKSVGLTKKFMERGANPQMVLLHESKDGKTSKVALGPIIDLHYEDRAGIGYAVGDIELSEQHFDTLLATNAFPRRSAEFWEDNDHMSEVALLGRETPRRPLPDTHFARKGTKRVCSQMGTTYGGTGGGQSAFVPSAEDTNMSDERIEALEKNFKSMCSKLDRMAKAMNLKEDGDEAAEDKPKSENAKGGVTRAEFNSLKEANSKMEAALSQANARAEEATKSARKAEMQRTIDGLKNDGYCIAEADEAGLVDEMAGMADPAVKVEFIKRNFSKLPINQPPFAHKGALPAGNIKPEEIAAIAEKFAGDPAGYKKAINERMGVKAAA